MFVSVFTDQAGIVERYEVERTESGDVRLRVELPGGQTSQVFLSLPNAEAVQLAHRLLAEATRPATTGCAAVIQEG